MRLGPDLDDLPHHLVAHDVAGQHRRDEVVEQMQVRAADGAARHLDDGVARLLDLGISDGVAADVFLAVPNEGSHAFLLLSSNRCRGLRVRELVTDTRACLCGDGLSGFMALERLRSGKCCG